METPPFSERWPDPARHPERPRCAADGCGVLEKGARGHADDKANRHDSPGCGTSRMPASTKGYQTRINALLRTYMDTNRTARKQGGTHLMDVGWNCTVALWRGIRKAARCAPEGLPSSKSLPPCRAITSPFRKMRKFRRSFSGGEPMIQYDWSNRLVDIMREIQASEAKVLKPKFIFPSSWTRWSAARR